jgi:hypothetical protein
MLVGLTPCDLEVLALSGNIGEPAASPVKLPAVRRPNCCKVRCDISGLRKKSEYCGIAGTHAVRT